ncbi:DUF4476 domain-containing protein [Hymenobacter sp. ASUV-10]|uniref:DUF4476 domain-containing protein n=1 Tax=Hymenobacter aranciens TaxID=3063996 RepID=A0ABT9B9G4_9BACT|nr:DUF4476 domain-containing protein [Hymenobacter sp. ASUV-10]MDO7873193.1 DUF4476 domain-containing protein [Hymenobacter sp. ASUV-10]
MNKVFVFLLLSWLAAGSALAAPLATAYFSSDKGVLFGLTLDGQALTRGPVRELRVEQLTPGEHWAEFALPGPRRSTVRLRSKVWLEPAAENRFVLVTRNGRPPELRAAGTTPLYAPGYGQPLPPPAPGYPNSNGGYGNNGYPNGNYPADPNGRYVAPNGYHVMSPQDVDALAASLKQRSFESTRLEVAKDALSQTSLYALDLQRLLRSFDFDASRVELAKFAYARVADPQNFYRVYEAFQFDGSVQEVRKAVGR